MSKILKITTKQGTFTTKSDWDMGILTRNLNTSGVGNFNKKDETINIGDFIFRKSDVIMVEEINRKGE